MLKVDESGPTVRVTTADGTLHRDWGTNRAGAWDYVCTEPQRNHRHPITGPGGWFRADDKIKGWTSDPRFALTKPLTEATSEEQDAARRATIQFIRARLGGPILEVFMANENDTIEAAMRAKQAKPEPVQAEPEPESAQNGPETSTEEPASDAEGNGADRGYELLSDARQNAYDNFAHMAEVAPSDKARRYWRAQADAILPV